MVVVMPWAWIIMEAIGEFAAFSPNASPYG